MIKFLKVFIFSFVIWLIFTVKFSTEFLKEWDIFVAGGLIALLSGILFRDMFSGSSFRFWHPKRVFFFIIYIPVFFFYCLLANFDVLYRIIHPKMPINPGIVKVRTNLKTAAGRTMLANSITLTPGTLTVAMKDEFLYIHWINVGTDDIDKASKEIVAKFERFLIKIYE